MSILTVDVVAPGWEPVRDAFVHSFDIKEDRGAGVAVYHRGKCVVDLMGGWRDREQAVPYDADTLQLVFSTTKGITSIAVAMCVERGLLSYEEKVSTYWPEFVAKGKADVTVAQLLSHRAGLYTVDGDITLEEALDWNTITSRLADTAPLFPVDSTHGYHALTFGWLAGELVRRVTGKSLGDFVREEIAGPLGVEMHVGLPPALEPRVAHLMAHPIPKFSPEEVKTLMETSGPGTKGASALSLNGAFGQGAFNRKDVHQSQLPGANGISNARSLARIYAALVSDIDGVHLLGESTRDRAATSNTPHGEMDEILMSATDFGMGFMVHSERTPFAGPSSFGHNGAGGSCAFAQPSRELGFAYVMNTMMTTIDGDPRPARLIDAVSRCADAE
jgi:CubicO group peptidase (beta-lactamase class C family)